VGAAAPGAAAGAPPAWIDAALLEQIRDVLVTV
jgi:hypothetical protein